MVTVELNFLMYGTVLQTVSKQPVSSVLLHNHIYATLCEWSLRGLRQRIIPNCASSRPLNFEYSTVCTLLYVALCLKVLSQNSLTLIQWLLFHVCLAISLWRVTTLTCAIVQIGGIHSITLKNEEWHISWFFWCMIAVRVFRGCMVYKIFYI